MKKQKITPFLWFDGKAVQMDKLDIKRLKQAYERDSR